MPLVMFQNLTDNMTNSNALVSGTVDDTPNFDIDKVDMSQFMIASTQKVMDLTTVPLLVEKSQYFYSPVHKLLSTVNAIIGPQGQLALLLTGSLVVGLIIIALFVLAWKLNIAQIAIASVFGMVVKTKVDGESQESDMTVQLYINWGIVIFLFGILFLQLVRKL